jgi:hypothetical protein
LIPHKLAYNIILILFGINDIQYTFTECGRSGNGGSIYVKNTGANFVIVNSQSIKSHGTSHGLFLYTNINSVKKYNFVLYCTISESYYSSGTPNGAIILYYGQIRIISTNSSNNVAYQQSSFYLHGIDNSAYSSQLIYSTEDGYINYCYVINGYANSWGCIWFYIKKYKCEESNIINNSQGSSGRGIIDTNGASAIITINKCCLINNNANNIGYLFYSSGTMEVRECTIQNGYIIKGAVTTSYSNTEAGNECAKIYYCGARIDRSCNQCRCSVYDNILNNNLYRLHVNKPFL